MDAVALLERAIRDQEERRRRARLPPQALSDHPSSTASGPTIGLSEVWGPSAYTGSELRRDTPISSGSFSLPPQDFGAGVFPTISWSPSPQAPSGEATAPDATSTADTLLRAALRTQRPPAPSSSSPDVEAPVGAVFDTPSVPSGAPVGGQLQACIEDNSRRAQSLPQPESPVEPAPLQVAFSPSVGGAPLAEDSPTLLDAAIAAGAIPALRRRPELPRPPPESPLISPAMLTRSSSSAPPPPPDVPLLFKKGRQLFALPVGRCGASVMKAKAVKASSFRGARDGDPALSPATPSRVAKYRPGISISDPSELTTTDLEDDPSSDSPPATSDEAKVRKLHSEIRRLMSLLTIPMVAKVLQYSPEEAEKIPPSTLSSELFRALAKRGIATMQGARRALVRLYDFALDRGVQLVGFNASTGLVSAFLSSQSAVTMPRALLLGLRWAARTLHICEGSLAPILDGFKSKARPSAPRPAMCYSLRVVMHLSSIATTYAGPGHQYVCATASGVLLMVQGSLRWADTLGCSFQPSADAIDGFTKRSKTGPMPWWAEILDVSGSSAWLAPLLAALAGVSKPDYVFRRGQFVGGASGDPTSFSGWAIGPASKRHVVKCLLYILTLPPLNLSPEEAMRYARLHGARRFLSTVARFLSGYLDISIQDRLELGRWSPGIVGDPGLRGAAASAAMPNLYSAEGARERCVASRKKICDELRRRVALLSERERGELPVDGCGVEFLLDASTDISHPDPDPDLSDAESDVGMD